ncbi:MAG: hypothetical protein EBS39_06605 [Gammaproteobacteria bacterium]|nr:hypothetical protein [Gammaproteobacteria bacterium]
MESLVPVAFKAFVALHIAFGSVGLVAFWVPVIGRKGGVAHKRWGKVFTWTMLATGTAAIGISACTLIDPLATHPHLVGAGATWIRGIFGWMMQGLAILTINLAWYGWQTVRHKADRAPQREWRNLALQALLVAASVNCILQAWLADLPLMLGMPAIGLATVGTNLWFLYRAHPGPLDWLKEHLKALVGAGISVYTAFFAFGAVRTFPELALHPGLWAIPLVVGLSIIIHQRLAVARMPASRRPAHAADAPSRA